MEKLSARDLAKLLAFQEATHNLQDAWAVIVNANSPAIRSFANKIKNLVYADEIPSGRHGDGVAWNLPDVFIQAPTNTTGEV